MKFKKETAISVLDNLCGDGLNNDEITEVLIEALLINGVVVPKGTLCEHNNCSWNKDPNKLKCLDCGEEISRA